MGAHYDTTSYIPSVLRKVAASTGNAPEIPYNEIIPASGYSESSGFGGTRVDIEIMNAAESTDSGSDDQILIETQSDGAFTNDGLANEEFGTIPFGDIPPGGCVMIRNLEGGQQYFRINNTSTVPVKVKYWYNPNRS